MLIPIDCLDLSQAVRDFYPSEVIDTSDLGEMFKRVFELGKLTNLTAEQLAKYLLNECYAKEITDIARVTET